LRLVPTFVVVTSITGDSPVTVTVSASDASGSCASIEIIWPSTTWTFSARHLLEAGQIVDNFVGAGRKRWKQESAVRLVTVDCTPMSAGDVTVTVTPAGWRPGRR